jgi:hypothetical protein
LPAWKPRVSYNPEVEEGLYITSNTVISDVTGGCPDDGPCYSSEDPLFPVISAGYGSSAAVVWHQQDLSNSNILNVYGDFY